MREERNCVPGLVQSCTRTGTILVHDFTRTGTGLVQSCTRTGSVLVHDCTRTAVKKSLNSFEFAKENSPADQNELRLLAVWFFRPQEYGSATILRSPKRHMDHGSCSHKRSEGLLVATLWEGRGGCPKRPFCAIRFYASPRVTKPFLCMQTQLLHDDTQWFIFASFSFSFPSYFKENA